ncbi:MAG: PhoH family protein, partial [Deltaproteobacteria bacterium]|nr:PhoH family protein [Deltaproteobacteria bacterium]
MKKNFVLDTNVLLHDPRALYAFAENNVVIPIYVIEEIDQFKRDLSELGRNARQVARFLDGFRKEGSLASGVKLPSGGTLRVVFTERELPREMVSGASTDNRIMAVALDTRDGEPETPAIFVTKDANLRIRADALGLVAEDYDAERVEIADLYTGYAEITVASAVVDNLYKNGEVEVDLPEHCPNEFVILRDSQNPSHTAMGKFSPARGPGKVVPVVRSPKEGVWGIRPRNVEQSFALDLLLCEDIKLITIVGKAGTGKTLLAIA